MTAKRADLAREITELDKLKKPNPSERARLVNKFNRAGKNMSKASRGAAEHCHQAPEAGVLH